MHACKQTLITLQQLNSDFVAHLVFVAQKHFLFMEHAPWIHLKYPYNVNV